jgi:hypothetical protein
MYQTDESVQSGFKPNVKQDHRHDVPMELPGEASPLNGGVYEMDGRHQAELA